MKKEPEMILVEKTINKKVFRLVLGSLIEEPVEAIVNPANENLYHGGGVAGLISKAGGPEIQTESIKKAPVKTGSASFTRAGKLPYKYIIHTVGPVYRGGLDNEPRLLASAVMEALKTADHLKLRSVSMPPISTGIFGYPLAPAIKIITETVFSFMETASSLEEVRLCEFERNKAENIRSIIQG
ncbi:MAG: macro domain-containing protein [Acidobacteriota bacterium]